MYLEPETPVELIPLFLERATGLVATRGRGVVAESIGIGPGGPGPPDAAGAYPEILTPGYATGKYHRRPLRVRNTTSETARS